MVEHHQTLDRGRLLPRIAPLFYTTHVGIELISAVIPVCCGLPLAMEIFSLVTELVTPLGRDLPSKG